MPPLASPIRVRMAGPEEMEVLWQIRREVFVQAQGVPVDREIDGRDAEATQFLALDGRNPVGTARLRVVDGHAKVERVAVREAWRGRGVGAAIMDAVEQHASSLRVAELVLSAQLPVIPI